MNEPTFYDAAVRDVQCGSGVTIVRPANLYECTLGDDCFVGPFTEIQRGVVIGRGSRVQSHVFICELVTIGEDCFISHGAKFVNDLWRTGQIERHDQSAWGRTEVGDGVLIGTNATILPVRIAAGVVVGAGAVVTHDLREPGIYAGCPARRIGDVPPRSELYSGETR